MLAGARREPPRVRRAMADRCDGLRQSPTLRGAGAIAAPTSPHRSRSLTVDPVLQMHAIGKRFPGVVALDQVDFTVQRGEIVALVGENGAGKSTLMKILAGIHRPDAGDIRIDGAPAIIDSPSGADRLDVAVIHQELEMIDTLDVAGNIYLGREPHRAGPLRLLDRAR